MGFIVTGSIQSQEATLSNFHLITNEKLSQQLKTFWEIEELPQKRLLTREEQSAETDFQNTVQRNPDGRYVVHIPRNHLANELGESKAQAFKRFYSLETRLNKNHELKTLYSNFMQEYINLGHMELANTQSVHTTHTSDQFYLPHHPVFKHDSSTTKLRVVFDGSAKSTSGLSLNDTLINGPVVQSELFDIMIRFRLSKFILTGDVEKMYRMIWVQSHQQSLQSILWRTNNDQPIQIYNLKTVTYGLHNSAYLATRTLLQLCNDQAHIYSRAATMVKHNTYVDDTLITANSESELVSLKQEIECMLLSAGFHMRKWCSNSQKVMNTIPPSERAKDKIFIPGKNETVKNLGTYWVPQTDTLQFKVNIQDREFTKRNILSEISKIYDILGLIGPVILKAKMFMQDLWSLSIGWDDILPDSQVTTWLNIKQDLLELSEFSISRPVSFQNRQIQVHVFADASEKAYGACLYVRSPYKDTYRVNLLSSKGKVSPLRKITLPRLELCAAVLAVKIADRIVDAMNLPIQSLTFWTDSKIVLAWLARSSATWQTFVANRVSIIQALSEIKQWKYISSAQNPADLISRGATSSMLQHSALWWHGPEFLLQHEDEWSQQPGESLQEIPEAKKNTMCLISNTQDMYQRFSSFTKLIRVTAWCKRFIHNSRPSVQLKKRGQLSLEELDEATSRVIKIAQSESFQSEINSLKHDKDILKSSSIKSLDPYLDQHGLLRVGGRLHKAPFSMDQRHPVILSDKHPVSRLIVKQEHLSKYWITNGRRLVNSVLKNCIVCFKNKPVSASQLMGQLPETRITPNRAFLYVGTDTAGPILLKSSQLRNAKLIKGYIAIFICFVTKAVHLEVVSDLTTEAFLAAFHRFVSRRGLCSHIFSDNAKTYISAAKELQQLHQSDEFKIQMHRRCTDMGITWHFTPPYGPHHGGLWESNIKIMKHHLNRIMGNLHYTYEQMSTLLTQIEAIMNSRPLSPLSNDHNDLLPLTPGHFLIGQALVSSHKADLTDIVQNKLSKWQHIQQSAQHFWHRWSKEYLNLLQPRKTWQNVQKNVQVGDLVLIKTDFSPPLKWNTGRIMEAHPGSDGLVRVVTAKTTQGIFRRPITKICLFPKEDV